MGGARTALFNWLFARSQDGTFILRIEDTDRERSSEAMTAAILGGLEWLGLDWDEGPYHQADGVERYRHDAQRLLETGAAYRCFCPPAELERRRASDAAWGEGEGEGEDGVVPALPDPCAALEPTDSAARAMAGQPFAVRFRVPAGVTEWDDLVHGPTRFDNREIGDFIILRSDGTPVYNHAVVSDDVFMRITHVIRGDDHLSNTPKQILLYRVLAAEPPRFAHVPMILGPDGKRLSKRHGATAVAEYESAGILPWAMVNFLALLGWSPGTDEEVMDVEQLKRSFSLARVLKKSSVFDVKKLEWLNGQHIARASAEQLEPLLTRRLVARGLDSAAVLRANRAQYLAVIDLLKARAQTLEEMADRARPYLVEGVEYEAAAVEKHWRDARGVSEQLRQLADRLAQGPWTGAALEERLRKLAADRSIPAARLIHPLRVALTGQAVSPGIFEVLVVLGRERSLRRVGEAVRYLRDRSAAGAGVRDR